MTLRRIGEWTLLAGVIALSAEILVRRWWFDQIPSQVHPSLVYTLLAINLATVGWRVRVWAGTQPEHST